MEEARDRALTRIFAFSIFLTPLAVEMEEARDRALTHYLLSKLPHDVLLEWKHPPGATLL